MRDDAEARLLRIFQDLFRYRGGALSDDVAMGALEAWDSMQQLVLVAEIEAAFGIRLTTDEILRMTSVGEIRRVLDRHLPG